MDNTPEVGTETPKIDELLPTINVAVPENQPVLPDVESKEEYVCNYIYLVEGPSDSFEIGFSSRSSQHLKVATSIFLEHVSIETASNYKLVMKSVEVITRTRAKENNG